MVSGAADRIARRAQRLADQRMRGRVLDEVLSHSIARLRAHHDALRGVQGAHDPGPMEPGELEQRARQGADAAYAAAVREVVAADFGRSLRRAARKRGIKLGE